ncbi:CDP-alcohol phosphatidyltransferase family protein [candidate division KSB1 bacterium]|nr:CDP-alcohol phosphatidyltransferase family protein [candidate division KSB1 bacterium]MCE7945613.1 CDP-alcohol phosphatidyltransferase family protein [Chlorobi bacterium CHB1]
MSTVTLKELREFKHRINPEERQGAYGYYFIRPLSLYVTYFALRLGLTANQVTVLQTLAGVAGAVLLAFPAPLIRLLGVALLQFGFVLDNVDGEVARFRKQVSVTGKFLDVVGHEIVIPFMFFGLGIGAYFQLGHFEAIIFGFLAGFFSLRFDMSAMYHEAAQLLETKLDQSYDYYANLPLEQSSALKIYRRKNEESAIRMLYALFAYPATMNIITVLIILETIFPAVVAGSFAFSPVYVFLALYGVLLPIRRVLTIRRLVQGRETERKYVALVGLLQNRISK